MSVLSIQQLNKYADKGLTGLANVGNSCYLNSCMQVLSGTHELSEFISDKNYKKKLNNIPESLLLLEWDKLRELMWSENCTIAPHGFVKSVQKVAHLKNRDIFTGHAQNDVQEFLLFIIDCFHSSLSREVDMQINGISNNKTDELAKICFSMMNNMYKKEYSDILNIFYGIHVSEITEMNTNIQLSLTPEPYSIISLSFPNKTENIQFSIFDCLDLYCQKEVLKDENAWFNSKTNKKENVKRGILFWSLPTILIFDLKRWNGYKHKINTLITSPLNNVDFSPYVKGYNSSSYIYDLYGICNHSGGILGGHYTAYVKNENGKWYEYNDTSVQEISEKNVISQKSYCFFYRKKK
jgi:ubiquitin carboxyl-terminal hydrolase 8